MNQDMTSRFLNRLKDKQHHAKSESGMLIKVIGENGKVKETIPHVRHFTENGLRFRVLHSVAKDKPLKLILHFSRNGRDILTEAKVVSVHSSARKNGYVVEAQFTNILEHDRNALQTFIAKYQK